MNVLDLEVYENYFLAMFKNRDSGVVRTFELYDGHPFDRKEALRVLKSETVVTFNGNNFDLPLFGQACSGKSCSELKAFCDDIIINEKKPWEIGIESPRCDHIDIIEVAPGQASLKIYGGRIHCPTMQDLPISPSSLISAEQRDLLKRYCENDLDTTIALYDVLRPKIALREQMSKEYKQDLRSKSDAQIAEAVIKSKLFEMTGTVLGKTKVASGTSYQYVVPDFIYFSTPVLQDTLSFVKGCRFVINASGAPKCDALEDHKVVIGGSTYSMGVGGLHSNEKCVAHHADDDTILVDRDVASYYPAIILNCGLFPKHMGRDFLSVYRDIVNRRLEAKRIKNTVVAESLKITINGSFGKFGSKYSVLYSPDLLIQTTITGQLSLLMLIEALEREGIPVVSANTDGIVIKCPKNKVAVMEAVVWLWEFFTNFETEATSYSALYSRDVNSYVAVKPDGNVKTKGAFATTSLQKSPANTICTDAVVAKLVSGTPIAETIQSATDVRKFITIRTVQGGATWQGQALGKAIRWYYSTAANEPIRYIKNGNKVSKTDGAMPAMRLPADIPEDIDYQRYIAEADAMLKSIGWK